MSNGKRMDNNFYLSQCVFICFLGQILLCKSLIYIELQWIQGTILWLYFLETCETYG